MLSYKAPIADIKFLFEDVFNYYEHYQKHPEFEEATPDLVDAIMEECAKFSENELLPLNQSGDEEGCTFNNGAVTTMYPGLSHGAMNTIHTHGTSEQKELYLTRLIEGSWTGTMCLTEPQCGTDLGQVKTKAEPNGDGTYNLTGTKIFISAGEHDLTENIIHIVLARYQVRLPVLRGFLFLLCLKCKLMNKVILVSLTMFLVVQLSTKWGLKALQLQY